MIVFLCFACVSLCYAKMIQSWPVSVVGCRSVVLYRKERQSVRRLPARKAVEENTWKVCIG